MRAIKMDCRESRGGLEYVIRGGIRASGIRAYVKATEPLALNDSGYPLALITSMIRKRQVEYTQPCSRTLLENGRVIAGQLQEWFPHFVAPQLLGHTVREPAPKSTARRVGAFFTGGVDSFYTFLENKDEITDLVYVHGFDIKLENTALREKVSREIREIAEHFGKNLVEVESNLKQALTRSLHFHWRYSHGIALAVVLHALSGCLDKIFVASSHTYPDISKWGSHPLIDPLWSSEDIEVVHHGYHTERLDKVRAIAEHPYATKRLRVCFENRGNKYNCGDCEKCLRTLTAMRIAGCIDQADSFAGVYDVGKLESINCFHADSQEFYGPLAQAVDESKDPELARVLREIMQPPSGFRKIVHMLKTSRRAKRVGQLVRVVWG